tara:strand:- start:548 stop:742 length:195 start_codon:yes stop_codon:yes gene_type:complete
MAYTVNQNKTISSNSSKDKEVASGKLTRKEYQILQDGLNWRTGKDYDRELRRLQQMYPTYFPRA